MAKCDYCNKETKIMLYDYMNIVPENPTEFLRYIIFKATDNALLIKNETTIEKIKESKNLDVTGLFRRYKEQHGLERLATIFHRFKPLFLAFKTNSQLSRYINKTRKLFHHIQWQGEQFVIYTFIPIRSCCNVTDFLYCR